MTAHATHAAPSREYVIGLETSFWDAMKAKDGKRAARLAGEPSLVSGAQGVMRIAKSKMGSMTEEGKWSLQSYDFDNIQVSTPTPDVAIIVYTVTQQVTMDGKPQTMHAADSSTWVRGPDGWECHAHSESLMKDNQTPH